jgi:two-component system, cell cycle sensor histidine kinase and response regulator CckA
MPEEGRTPLASEQTREQRRDRLSPEALLRQLLESNMQGVFLWDSDGTVVDANDAFLRISGFSRDELRAGMIDWLGLVPPGTLERARRSRRQLFETGLLEPTERELVRRDGSHAHVLLSGSRAPGNSSAIVFVHDLTESHRRESVIRSLESRLELVTEAAPVALWTAATDGTITQLAGGQWLGLEPGVGRSFFEQLHDRPELQLLARRALAGETIEGRVTFADRLLEVRLRPLRAQGPTGPGKVEGVAGVAVDVTDGVRAAEERTRLETRLAQVQRRESVGMLASGLAHEFNNLLAGVLANVSAALQAAPAHPGGEALRDALSSAQRAAELTRQLLSTAAGAPAEVRNLDLSEQVRELRPLLEASAPQRIRLELELGSALPSVRGNPDQLRQALVALVAGATEASAPQVGRVRISTSLTEISGGEALAGADRLEPGWYVQLAVSDDGPALDTKAQRQLFDPFFHGVPGGRSLGLAAVLGNVRALRGGLRLHSGDAGTRVEVLLPASGVPDRPRLQPKPPPPATSRTVLVVDDNEVVRRAALRILKAIDIPARAASDGDEAVRILREDPEPVGLILLDFAMPGMNGEQTLRAIRELRPEVRVLLCSGYSEEAATWRLEAGELTGFLAKPFTARELQRAVRFALEGVPSLPTPPGGVLKIP